MFAFVPATMNCDTAKLTERYLFYRSAYPQKSILQINVVKIGWIRVR